MRRHHRVTRADLGTLRVPLKKAAPFIVTADPASAAACSTASTSPRASACRGS